MNAGLRTPSTANEPWCWGYQEHPLLPAVIAPYLIDVELPPTPESWGGSSGRLHQIAQLCGGVPWRTSSPTASTDYAAETLARVLDGSRAEAVRGCPVLRGTIENPDALARLPFRHSTVDVAEACGLRIEELGAVLTECSLGDLIDLLDDDLYAVLDLAVTIQGWSLARGAGVELRSPITETLDLRAFGLFLARQLFVAHRPRRINEAHVLMIAALEGWAGEVPATLQAAGEIVGLTRERVRQVRNQVLVPFDLRRRWPAPRSLLALLDEIVQFIDADDPAARMLLPPPIDLPGGPVSVLALARECGLADDLAIGPDDRPHRVVNGFDFGRALSKVIRRAARATGFATLSDVLRLAQAEGIPVDQEQIASVIARDSQVIELPLGYFYAGVEDAAVLGSSHRMLAVTPEISVSELHRGLTRRAAVHYKPAPPPVEVLRQFYCRHPAFVVDDDFVRSVTPFVPDFSQVQWRLVQILMNAPGGAMHWDEIAELALQGGIKLGSVRGYLQSSEMIVKVAPAVYTVIGRVLPPGTVERVSTRARAANTPMDVKGRFVAPHHYVVEGILNRVACNYGSIPTNPSIRQVLGHDAFVVAQPAGYGETRLKVGADSKISSLVQPFAKIRPMSGDAIAIEFDLEQFTAIVRVGGDEVLSSPFGALR